MNNEYALKRSGNVNKRSVLALVSSTFGIGFILFASAIANSAAEPIPPVLPQIINPTVINMKQAGAKGDGVSDDSAIIQSIINNAPSNTKLYFPQGTYRLHNIEVRNRSKLIFEGDGNTTILQWRGVPVNCPGLVCDYTAMISFTAVSDLIIQNMALDNKAIKSFGGIRFYEMKRVLIQNTHFYDSSPAGFSFQHGDRYSYVFGQSSITNDDIAILNNTFEDLQLEVDHSRRVRIEGNTSLRSAGTGALGTWAVGSNAVLEDYLVTKNTVVDPNNFAIAFIIDHDTYWNNTFRRIKISDNDITRNVAARNNSTIAVGAGTVATQQGNIFEDIIIEGNEINVGGSFLLDDQSALIVMQGSEPAGFNFERVTITDNQITANNQSVGFAIDARRMHNSLIEGNIITGIGVGIAVADDPVNTQVKNNTVEASVLAYHFSWSGGNNRFETNYYVGNPTTIFEKLRVTSSDILEDPIKVSSIPTTPPAPPSINPPPGPSTPPSPLDTTAPTISNISASSITSGSAIISWNTDEASDTQVEYGPTASYGLLNPLDSSQTTLHTVTLSNLSPGTVYNYRVKSRDQAENVSVSLNTTFATLSAPASEAPLGIENSSVPNTQTNSFTASRKARTQSRRPLKSSKLSRYRSDH